MSHLTRSSVFAVLFAVFFFAQSRANASVHVEWKCEDQQPKQICAVVGSIDYIYIHGTIAQETANSIAQLDGIWPVGRPFPVVFVNSIGGEDNAARQIGRILRRREATVETKDAFFPANRPTCFSACVTIAAGGVVRRISHVGIHQAAKVIPIRGRETRDEPEGEQERMFDRLYWKEMGISDEINRIVDDTPHTEMAEFFIDPEIPLQTQTIVRLGFWMGAPPESNETLIADRTSNFDLLVAAWERGNRDAAYTLGKRFFNDGDVENAALWLNRAGDAGLAYAWHDLAVLLASKRNPRGPAHEEAERYYRMAAERGFAGAQNNLGWAYYKGNGVPQSYGEAIHWLTRAAEQGEPFAYGSLGDMRFHARGFPRDDVEAYKWLKLAIDNLPPGTALDEDRKLFEDLKKRMPLAEIEAAEQRVKDWRPLRVTPNRIGDKED